MSLNLQSFNHLKIGGYIRKSNESDDKQMQSIEDQHTVMDELEKRYEYKTKERYVDKKSAKEPFQRPGFSALVQAIEKGEINAIACWKLNRLARNLTEAGVILDYLSSGKIQAIITPFRVFQPTDNTVALVVEFGIAKQTSKDIGTDVMRANRLKAERGWNPAPILKMGYEHNPLHKKNGGNPIVNSPIFSLVKELWKEALEHHYSFADIKRRGDELGIRQTSGPHKGNLYSYNAYQSAFTDPFYSTGEFIRNDIEGNSTTYYGKHEKMISEADFNKVQLQFGKRGRPTKINKYDFALSGCLECATCGCAVVAERVFRATCTQCKKRFSLKNRTDCPHCGLEVSEMENPVIYDRSYYRCSKQRNKGDFKCPEPYIEATSAEQQVQNKLNEVEVSKDFHDWAIAAFQFMHQEEVKEQDAFNQQISKQETELVKQLREFVIMRSRKEISPEQLKDLTVDTEKELESVRSAKKDFHERVIDWAKIANDYTTYAEVAPKIFAEASNERKREILRTFGSNLVLKDGNLSITTPKTLTSIKSSYVTFMQYFDSLEPVETVVLQGFTGLEGRIPSDLLPD